MSAPRHGDSEAAIFEAILEGYRFRYYNQPRGEDFAPTAEQLLLSETPEEP